MVSPTVEAPPPAGSTKFPASLAFLPAVWLSVTSLLPIGVFFLASFLTVHAPRRLGLPVTLSHYQELIQWSYFWTFLQSLWPACLASLLCLLIGYPLVLAIQALSLKLGSPTWPFALCLIPFSVNSLLRLYGLRSFLGARGWLNRALMAFHLIHAPLPILYSQTAILLGLIYSLLPFMLLPLWLGVRKLHPSLLEASRDLGATPLQSFFWVTFPLTLPAALSGFLMTFVSAVGMYYVSDLLGGMKQPLLGNLLKSQMLILRETPLAAATSVLLTALVGLLIWFHSRLLHKQQPTTTPRRQWS